MRQLPKLFIINITGKLFTLLLFAALTRILSPEHLAFIALIPALAPIFLSLFGAGINTLIERDAPRALAESSGSGYQMMRTSYVYNLFVVLVLSLLGISLVELWSGFISKEPNDVNLQWLVLPIATYMILQSVGLHLLVDGKAAKFGMLKVYGDIFSKASVLLLYLIEPSEKAVFLGLAIGQMPFIFYGVWSQRHWLFKFSFVPIASMIRKSIPFYIESNFNTLRNQGDNLFVTMLLGPIALAEYYVAKTVANQLSVLYNPVSNFMTHRLSSKKGEGEEAMNSAFKQVWLLGIPFFIFFACAAGAISPLLIELIAGETYTHVWPVAIVLCLLTCALAAYSVSSRVLLIIGSPFERFKITILQTILIVCFSFALVPLWESIGVALAWLLALLISLFFVKKRAKELGFQWPSIDLFNFDMFFVLVMPILPLYLFSQNVHNAVVLLAFILVATFALLLLVRGHDDYQESQMTTLLPRKLLPSYKKVRELFNANLERKSE